MPDTLQRCPEELHRVIISRPVCRPGCPVPAGGDQAAQGSERAYARLRDRPDDPGQARRCERMTEYRELPELPGYRFGADGSVQSRWIKGSKRHRMGQVWGDIKPRQNSRRDYLYITLKTPAGRKHFRVNVLILWAFT